ncbi:MAG TPA: hypothetical protein VFZ95_10955 [Steroidobacteraceae bacterium]
MNQQLIEQYVAGKLAEAEAEAFEVACLEDPELARQVEFEQRLKAGFEQVARGSTAEFVRAESTLSWRLAAAASVVLFLCAGVYLWQRLPGSHPEVLAAVTRSVERDGPSMRLALVRGAESAPQLPAGNVRVEIVGLFDPGSGYSVVLDRLRPQRDVTNVATLQDQHPSSPVTLEIMLDSDQLSSGTYSLRVRKQASDEEALEFIFEK